MCSVAEHHRGKKKRQTYGLSSYTAYYFGLAQGSPYQGWLSTVDSIQKRFCPVVKLENVLELSGLFSVAYNANT